MRKSKAKEKKAENHLDDKIEGTRTSSTIFVNLYPVILIFLIGALCYSNTFNNPFVFDDKHIEEIEGIHLDNVSAIELTGLGRALMENGRPVAYATFALNYYFGKLNTVGYHIVNLGIHLITALLVYFFLRLTLDLPSMQRHNRGQSQKIALLCSLLFVAHPVQTQAVTYIIQRMTSLAAMFYLLSLVTYIKGKTTGGQKRIFFYATSVLTALLAFGSKEPAVTLPITIGMYELFFFQGLNFNKYKKKSSLFFFLFIVLVIFITISTQKISWIQDEFKTFNFNMFERVITEFRVIIHYLTLLLLPLPSRLNLSYDFPISRSIISPPTTLISAMIIVGLIIVAMRIAKKRPLISFGVFWYLITLAPESTILPIDLVFEHRLYLPSVGFFIIVSLFLINLLEFASKKNKLKLQLSIMVPLIFLLSWGTYQRNMVWNSKLKLWIDVANKSPRDARAHSDLGMAYASAGMIDKAIKELYTAVKLNPMDYLVYDNLARAYNMKGMSDDAIGASLEAIKLNPDFLLAYATVGVAYNKKKMYDQTIQYSLDAFRRKPIYPKSYFKPTYAECYVNLGVAYKGKGEFNKAIQSFQKACELYPRNFSNYNQLGLAFIENKNYQEAKEAFLTAIEINNNFSWARKNLGNTYYLLGKNNEAIEEWKKALLLNPQDKPLADILKNMSREKK